MEWAVAILSVLVLLLAGRGVLLNRQLSREVILRLLREGSSYGLDLIAHSDGVLRRGTVYIYLSELEDEGRITSWKQPIRASLLRGGLPRRLYALTQPDSQEAPDA